MNDVDYILAVHRAEQRRVEAIGELAGSVLFLVGYGLYRLIEWLA